MKRQVAVGQHFGKLVVLSQLPSRYNKKYWLCQCECGNTCEKSSSALLTATGVVSCGCYRPPYREDLRGKKFNKLTVIDFDAEYNKKLKEKNSTARTKWTCQCDCGKICYVDTTALKKGLTKSCGCLKLEQSAKIMKEKVQPLGAQARFQDLTGQRFGRLKVMHRTDNDNNANKVYYKCKCDCGNECIVGAQALRRGDTQSCGCLGNSTGEVLIKEILEKAQIPFKQEVSFSDLKDKKLLRYDFAIYNRTKDKIIGLIEYDGRQHTDITSQWYNKSVVQHDIMKNEYAKQHHIPLFRIDYRDKEKISISYILEGLLKNKESF